MVPLSFFVLLATVIITGANEDVVSEELDTGFYGLDDPNTALEPEVVAVVVPAQSPGPSGSLQSNNPFETDNEDRRGGHRHHHQHRHHHHHRGRHHHRHHHHGNSDDDRMPYHHGMHRGWYGNWTEEQKLTHLCTRLRANDVLQTTEATTSSSVSRDTNGRRRPGFGFHWRLRALNETARQTIIEVWNRRRQDMLGCCDEGTTNSKMQCVANVKASRYDRVCRGEEPLCYWAALMSSSRPDASSTTPAPNNRMDSTTNTTTRCCALQGTERVQCFTDAKNNYRMRMHERFHGRRPTQNWPHAHMRGNGNMGRRRNQQETE